jgi:dihydropyrimidinase
MATIVRNGTVITATDRYVADLCIEDGTITRIGLTLPVGPGDAVIDAAGRWVLPGAIDVHTHLDMPFMGTCSADDFLTGTRAAAAGGTTCVVDFAIAPRGGDYEQALDAWHAKAEGKAVIDYGFHMCVTWFGKPEAAAGIRRCVERGVTSFKCFMAYKGSLYIDDEEMFGLLALSRDLGAQVSVHAENGSIVEALVARNRALGRTQPVWHARSRPPAVEGEATNRAIVLAKHAGASLYVVHLTCAEALDAVRRARAAGQDVHAETCPQYLMFTDEVYERPDFQGAKWVMSPPIRPAGHPEALWAGLADGTLEVVATDHCPFQFGTQKVMGKDDFSKIPNGAPGIGDRMAVLYHYGVKAGRIDVHRWIDACCTRPARLFGLSPRKGTIAVGADADIVVFDPDATFTFGTAWSRHAVDYSLYEGMPGSGAFDVVLSRGRVVWKGGVFLGEPGAGRFLHRTPGGAPRTA